MHIAHKLLISVIAALVIAMVGGAVLITENLPAPIAAKSRSNVMVALGDSLTAASNACGKHNACKEDSWSTGSNTQVNAVAARIQRATGKKLKVYNYAHIGDKVGALNDQLDKAIKLRPGIITIAVGSNDFCTDNVNQMTSTASFTRTFETALAKLHAALPDTKILVTSTINPQSLWQNLHTNSSATKKWAHGLCGAMLSTATSTGTAATQQRQAVVTRGQAFNTILRDTCKLYTQTCHYTAKVYKFAYTITTVSTVDYLHPNVAGQASLAKLVFTAPGVKKFLTR